MNIKCSGPPLYKTDYDLFQIHHVSVNKKLSLKVWCALLFIKILI